MWSSVVSALTVKSEGPTCYARLYIPEIRISSGAFRMSFAGITYAMTVPALSNSGIDEANLNDASECFAAMIDAALNPKIEE